MRPQDQRQKFPRHSLIPRTLIFLTREDEILLLRGAPDKPLWANHYNGLGGHVEAGETLYAAALRELREESGIEPRHLNLRALIHVALPEPPGVLLAVFLGEAPAGTTPRPSPEGTPEWIKQTDVQTLPLVEDLFTLLPRLLQPGPLFYGHYTFTENGLQMRWDIPSP